MSISHLRERVLVQTRAYISDQVGGYKLSWADRCEFWAEVTPVASETEQLNDTKDLTTLRYRLRWRVGTTVPSTARLIWRGKYLRFVTQPREDVYRRFTSAIAKMEADHE